MATSAISNQKTIEQIIKSTTEGKSTRNTGDLGKDAFINLLVTQLRYQDPLNPVDDKEFIGQMAQFSALEQMQNLNGSFSAVKAFSLIGKNVIGTVVDETTKEIELVEGEVTNVKMSNGNTYVVVNGRDIPVDKIIDVSEAYMFSHSNISVYTNLIGYKVSGAVYNPNTGEIIGVKGVVRAIQKGIYEDYAVMDGVNVEIAEIVTDEPSTDPDFMKDYLEEHKDGKKVTVVIVDRETGYKVTVSGNLRSYEINDGKITAVLDRVLVPVDSVSRIEPVENDG